MENGKGMIHISQTAQEKVVPLTCLKEGFLLGQELRGNKPKTIVYYEENIDRLIDFLHERGIDDSSGLTEKNLHAYTQHLNQQNKWEGLRQEAESTMSDSSLRAYIRAIKAWVRWADKGGYIHDRNVVRMDLPTADSKPKDIISKDEFTIIENHLLAKDNNTYRDLLIIKMFYECGLTLSECISIKRSDMNVPGRRFNLRGEDGQVRTIAYSNEFSEFLFSYFQTERPNPSGKENFILLMADGKGITQAVVKRLFRNLQENIGIHRVSPQLLRQTYCVNFLKNGGSACALMELTGHKSFQAVEKYVRIAATM